MMSSSSGLDCIALAVAHLEKAEREAQKVSAEHRPSELPPRKSFKSEPRLVSADLFDVSSLPKTMDNPSSSAQGTTTSKPTIASVAHPRALPMSSPAEHMDIRELRAMLFSLDLEDLKKYSVTDPKNIASPSNKDVLCGRGGETNHHPGNVFFRTCVKACQVDYIEAKRRDKPFIAQRIVLMVRKVGGRFLKRDSETTTWKEITTTKSREKTSQALREGAPDLRGDTKQVPETTRAEALKRRAAEMETWDASLGSISDSGSRDSPQTIKKRQTTMTKTLEAYAATVSPRSSLATASLHSMDSAAILPSFSATISADDEEGSLQSNPVPPKVIKGPRVKLLKRRLECDDSL